MKSGDSEGACHGRMPDAEPPGTGQRNESVPIGAPKQAATECAEQILGVARPCHRSAENSRPQDSTSREGGLQRTGGAVGKGESLVKDGRRKAGHKGLGQESDGMAIQLKARSPEHLTVGLQAPGTPLREADQ